MSSDGGATTVPPAASTAPHSRWPQPIRRSPNLRAPLEEAQRFLAASQQRFGRTIAAALEQIAVDAAALPRVGKALDLLMGKSELYLQQPSMLYFPELAQRAFFERSEFEWAATVEAATDEIRDELRAVLTDRSVFTPYIQSEPNAPRPDHDLLDDTSWGAFHIFQHGQPHPVNAARCPRTVAALGAAPMPRIGTRSPMALFSRLTPGTHIAPHHGAFNTRLICHLPLIVPPGCGIRVGAETRGWREGELLIFDDSIEHEAWNRGTDERVVLIFEIWRPDIAPAERDALTALLASIEQHGMLAGVAD